MIKFDAEYEVERLVNLIREYYKENNAGGAVIGISGGKDSAVVAALMTRAIGSENVIGLTLPCHSKETDRVDANKLAEHYGFKIYNIDLTNVYDMFREEVNKLGNFSLEELENSDINIKPRLRMASLYYMSALMSAVNNKTYLVAGTSNKCELYVGYFTKGGDSVSDIAPIADYTVSEVLAMGRVLGVDHNILNKAPSDGLSGLSDEEKLGVKYADIEAYMAGDETVTSHVSDKIRRLHLKNLHKFNTPNFERK